ncbi:MAG: lipid-A-disaccharide synthase N-terminal domain-containing protein [Candidatus Rokubacteria bacterium]|nr:lipid-A-disaccharide synthase N-terminal domain-containing protein [Candidatus Rokubacteria bacterium]
MSDPCAQQIGWVLLAFGFLGQAFFSMRFLVQWVASERRKESVIPIYFWYFSVGGGLTLLIYAVLRLDPVFILGQTAGLFVYGRNLYLIWRKRERLAAPRQA